MKKTFLFLLVFFSVISIKLYSENVKNLYYKEFISEVLKKNLNIKSYKLDVSVARLNIDKYKGIFDPKITTELSKDFQKEFTGSILQNNTSDFVINKNIDFNMSVSKKFSLGTSLSLSFSNNRFKTNSDWVLLNPTYTSQLTMKISQPLLKGLGVIINRSEIIKAENSLKKTEIEIKDYINKEILDASMKYFDLVYAYKYYEAKKEALRLAKNTLKINIKKVQLGLLPENMIKEAEAEVESREEDVLKARQDIFNIEDSVKVYIDDINGTYRIKPLTPFFSKNMNMSLNEAVNFALQNRYEIRKLKEEIKNAKLDVLKNRNNLKPDLSLNLYAGISGKGDSYGDNIDRLKTNHYHTWGIGLEFSYPIFNREAKANYKISNIIEKQLEIKKQTTENDIVLQVKKSLRNLDTLKKRIEANMKALESAYEKMQIEEKKYSNKLSTVFKVFSYQTDYVEQKIKLLRARTDYSKEILNFYYVIGKELYSVQ